MLCHLNPRDSAPDTSISPGLKLSPREPLPPISRPLTPKQQLDIMRSQEEQMWPFETEPTERDLEVSIQNRIDKEIE